MRDTDVMPVDGLHPQEVGDLSLQPRNCKHRDAAAVAHVDGLLRAAHTEDTREDLPAVPLDPALVRMIPVGRTGETADGDLPYVTHPPSAPPGAHRTREGRRLSRISRALAVAYGTVSTGVRSGCRPDLNTSTSVPSYCRHLSLILWVV